MLLVHKQKILLIYAKLVSEKRQIRKNSSSRIPDKNVNILFYRLVYLLITCLGGGGLLTRPSSSLDSESTSLTVTIRPPKKFEVRNKLND